MILKPDAAESACCASWRCGQEDGDQREGTKIVIAKCRIDHAAAIVDHHLLVKRGAELLRDAPFDLTAALHGIGDLAGICGMHAFQYLDFTGGLVHRDAEALDIEGD